MCLMRSSWLWFLTVCFLPASTGTDIDCHRDFLPAHTMRIVESGTVRTAHLHHQGPVTPAPLQAPRLRRAADICRTGEHIHTAPRSRGRPSPPSSGNGMTGATH